MTNAATTAARRRITVAIVNHNGATTLAATLRSVFRLRDVELASVMVVDNASTDDSAALVAREFPSVRWVRLPENRGPNPARNTSLRLAETERVLIMDNDIVLAPDYAARLCAAMDEHPDAGAVGGQIRLADSGEQVQYNGADIHYAGEIRLRDFAAQGTARVGCLSAGATLFPRARVLDAGGFDESLFFGWEDGDLTFRLTLFGWPCYVVSEAVAYHRRGERSLRWMRFQARNRWRFLLTYYERRTLLLAAPAILLFQTAAGLYCLFKGRWGDFVAGTREAFRERSVWRDKRVAVQQRRRLRDRDVLCGDRLHIAGPPAIRWLGLAVSAFCRVYWLLIFPWLRRRPYPPQGGAQ